MSVNCRFLNHTLLTRRLPIDSRILTVCILLQDERGDIEPMAEYFAPPRDHKEVKTFLFFWAFWTSWCQEIHCTYWAVLRIQIPINKLDLDPTIGCYGKLLSDALRPVF